MKITIAMDSYKRSLTAQQACSVLQEAFLDTIKNKSENLELSLFPLADGGEGTVQCLVYNTKGRIVDVDTSDLFGKNIKGYYGVLGDGETAVVESACASGILTLKPRQLDPMSASSYGTGDLIKRALKDGYKKLIIAFGGTATSDGGMGALEALGMLFKDKHGNTLKASGDAMRFVHSIDASNVCSLLKDANIQFACDVQNTYYGAEGAAYIFAPQKGADKQQVQLLDEGLRNLAHVFKKDLSKDIANIPCSGAAGGLTGGLMTVCTPQIESGFDIITSYTNLEQSIQSSDWVITGEGRTDAQTAYGKLPMRVGQLAKKYSKPVICISGAVTQDAEILKDYGITALFSISRGPAALNYSIRNSKQLLYQQAINIAALMDLL